MLQDAGDNQRGGDGVRVEEVGVDNLLPGGEQPGEVGGSDAAVQGASGFGGLASGVQAGAN